MKKLIHKTKNHPLVRYSQESFSSEKIRENRYTVLAIALIPFFLLVIIGSIVYVGNQRDKDTRAAASVTKAQVISYLQSLSNSSGSSKKLIAGQHVGQTSNYTQADRGTVLVEDMASRMNGEYVGMIGADLGGGSSFDTGLSNYLIDYWNKGGLITVSWHRKNPATGGTEKDTATNPIPAILSSSSSTTKTEYYKQLDTAAASLKKLQDNGVVVLYRPFHEMTINAFWWGCRDQTQYKQLWQTEYNYLTNTKGLSNLVWVWNPHRSHSCTNYPHLGYYPGSQYVDVVGADAYECINATTKVWGSAVKTLYDQLVTLGKPVAFPEVGESRSSCRLGTYTDYRNVFNSIKNNYPKVAYFIVWNADMSYKYNDQQVSGTYTSRAALQNSYVVNRGEHSIFNSTTPTPTPPAPTPTPPAPITQPVTATLSGLTTNSTVSGTINATVSIQNATKINKVEFYIDSNLINTEYTAPYTLGVDSGSGPVGFDTTTVSDGAHTLKAIVTYNDTQKTEVSTNFNVLNNPASLEIVGISNNQSVSNQINAEAIPKNATTINKIDFYINDNLINTEYTAPYTLGVDSGSGPVGFDTTTIANGNHRLRSVMTYDTNKTIEQSVLFSINNVDPNQEIQAENAQYIHNSSLENDSQASQNKAMKLHSTGSWVSHTFSVSQTGTYTLGGLLRSQDYRGSAIAKIQIDGKTVLNQYASGRGYKALEVKNLQFSAGSQHTISIEFTNDRYDNNRKDRNLWVDTLYLRKQ